MNTNKILNISSNYNIRLLFSYLEYDSFVKIIKYNKLIQDKLNIKIDYNHYYDIKKSKCHIQKSKDQLIDLFNNSSFFDILLFETIFTCNSFFSIFNELFTFNKLIGIIFIIIFYFCIFCIFCFYNENNFKIFIFIYIL